VCSGFGRCHCISHGRVFVGSDTAQEVATELGPGILLLRGEGQEVGDRFKGGYLGLQFRVRGEEVLELLALVLGQGTESEGLLKIVEAVATRYAAHPGTSIPRKSECPQIFCSPSLM
jgi:hypothetical protein